MRWSELVCKVRGHNVELWAQCGFGDQRLMSGLCRRCLHFVEKAI